MNEKEIQEIRTTLTDHEHRIAGIEKIQAVMSETLKNILGILKWIAGIAATIAAALILEFIKGGV